MLNILAVTLSHERPLYKLLIKRNADWWFISLFFLSLLICALAVDLDNSKREYIKVCAIIISITGGLLFVSSVANMIISPQYISNYEAICDEHKMKHLNKIYPSLPNHRIRIKRTWSKSIKRDIRTEHKRKYKKQLTKPIARKDYINDKHNYNGNISSLKNPFTQGMHIKPKLYGIHWWNFL